MNERILTVKEAAAILRISQSKLYQLVREKAVPHVTLGGRVVIPEKQLFSWLERAVCGG
jgi:excisionase family DNA binding protein